MTEKENELKIIGLVQRIGEIVSEYEYRIIELRASMTEEVNRLNEENRNLREQIKNVALQEED